MTALRLIRAVCLGVVLGLVIVACSTDFIRIEKQHKDKAQSLEEVRKILYNLSNGKLGDPNISLGFMYKDKMKTDDKTGQTVVGTCNYALADRVPEIDIRRDYWEVYNLRERLILLAHEYFHCECPFFGHIEGSFKDGCPKDFMNPSLPGFICAARHWKLYEKQIKEGCNGVRRHKVRDGRTKAADVQIR